MRHSWWKLPPAEKRAATAACNALLCAVANPEATVSQVFLLKDVLGQIVGRRVVLRVLQEEDASRTILGAADYPTE